MNQKVIENTSVPLKWFVGYILVVSAAIFWFGSSTATQSTEVKEVRSDVDEIKRDRAERIKAREELDKQYAADVREFKIINEHIAQDIKDIKARLP